MCPSDTFVRADDVVCRLVQGEALIVPVRGKVGDLASIYSLKGVGAAIWEALATARSVKELTELIVSEYDVSLEQAAADVEAFLAELIAQKLCVALPSKG